MKELLKIERDEEGDIGSISVHCDCKEDLSALSQALFSVFTRKPEIFDAVILTALIAGENPDMAKSLENTISVPDFNEILKNIK